jgi:hypothetical protein
VRGSGVPHGTAATVRAYREQAGGVLGEPGSAASARERFLDRTEAIVSAVSSGGGRMRRPDDVWDVSGRRRDIRAGRGTAGPVAVTEPALGALGQFTAGG